MCFTLRATNMIIDTSISTHVIINGAVKSCGLMLAAVYVRLVAIASALFTCGSTNVRATGLIPSAS